jgi:hypothetical protein
LNGHCDQILVVRRRKTSASNRARASRLPLHTTLDLEQAQAHLPVLIVLSHSYEYSKFNSQFRWFIFHSAAAMNGEQPANQPPVRGTGSRIQIDNAIRALQNKKPVPEIDFTLHTMEDGSQASTLERVCKGTINIHS